MADTRNIRHSIKRLGAVKTWQLVIVLILLAFIAATFMRLNNTGMIARRDAVIAADKAGDTGAIEARLYELQSYSSAHMNTDTGVFYLQEQYNRDAQKAVEVSSSQSGVTADANALAEATCHPQYHGWSTAYMNCFLRELAKYPTTNKLPEPVLPSPSLYRYSFASPTWSPDFAGWTVVACFAVIVLIIARLIGLVVLRLLLRRHYRES
ncbi:MAG: hypothetical protein ABIP74_01180 [Candidatus Saccharimonas sp.]